MVSEQVKAVKGHEGNDCLGGPTSKGGQVTQKAKGDYRTTTS